MKKVSTLFIAALFSLSSLNSSAQAEATFYTSMGDFKVLLHDSLKPITAGNFMSLAHSKFYDGVIFHRIIKNFVVQGGDPQGNGTGGPGYTIADEFDSSLSNVIKTLSMANSGPNSGGSQFFINLKNNTHLDFDKNPLTSKHPVFGIVIDNWPLVEAIANVPVNGNDKPLTDVVMDSVRITKWGVGVTEYSLNSQMRLFPNPISNTSRLNFESTTTGLAQITVYAPNGALIYEETRKVIAGTNEISLAAIHQMGLASGLYQLVLQKDGLAGYSQLVVR